MTEHRRSARLVARRARSLASSVLGRRPPTPAASPSLRKPFESACYAPTVSMYFDQFGNVRACCQNTETLMGNVTRQSIRQIWESDSTRSRPWRSAVARLLGGLRVLQVAGGPG